MRSTCTIRKGLSINSIIVIPKLYFNNHPRHSSSSLNKVKLFHCIIIVRITDDSDGIFDYRMIAIPIAVHCMNTRAHIETKTLIDRFIITKLHTLHTKDCRHTQIFGFFLSSALCNHFMLDSMLGRIAGATDVLQSTQNNKRNIEKKNETENYKRYLLTNMHPIRKLQTGNRRKKNAL